MLTYENHHNKKNVLGKFSQNSHTNMINHGSKSMPVQKMKVVRFWQVHKKNKERGINNFNDEKYTIYTWKIMSTYD